MYKSYIKVLQEKEQKQKARDYKNALIFAPLCMIIVYILYVLVWSVFSI
jgi:hypothetical protein